MTVAKWIIYLELQILKGNILKDFRKIYEGIK